MFRLFSLLIIFFTCNLAYSQWSRVYAPPTGNQAFARAIAADATGNIYIGGFWWSGENTEDNFILIKYNQNGDTVWTRNYNGPTSGQDRINCLAIDLQGNIIAVGESESSLHYDFLTIKYDPQGNMIWTNRFNWFSNSYDYPSAAATDGLSNIYIAGKSSYGSNYMITVIKYSPTGGLLWAKSYKGDSAGENYPASFSVSKTSGNLFITGYITSTAGHKNITTLKYSPNGNLLWDKRFSGSGLFDNAGKCIGTDAADNAYVTGYIYNDSVNADYVTIKYSTSGYLLWTKYYGGSSGGADIPVSIKVDSVGNNYITGSSVAGINEIKYAAIKYDSAGTLKWLTEFSMQGSSYNSPVSSALSAAGNLIVAGNSSNINPALNDYVVLKYNNVNGNITGNYRFHFPGYNNNEPTSMAFDGLGNCILTGFVAGDSSLLIGTLKVNENTIGIKGNIESIPDEFYIRQNYPNPFNPETNIKFYLKRPGFVTIRIYDMLGNEISVPVNKYFQSGSYTIAINALGLASGIYFYEMDAGGEKLFRKMALVK